jgi:hypothetical protein
LLRSRIYVKRGRGFQLKRDERLRAEAIAAALRFGIEAQK